MSAFYLPPPPAFWGITAPGLYVPNGWGSNFKAKARSGALTTVVNFSASIWNGFYSSNWQRTVAAAPTGVEGLVMDGLQRLYGDGGSGFISVVSTTGVTAGSASTITPTGAGGAVGGWDTFASGMNSFALFPHAALNGATLVDTNVRGTTIDIYWLKVGVGHNFAYNIDGAGAVTVNGVATDGNSGVTTIAGLSDTTHNLVISAPAGQPFIMGWRGRRASGIVPIRMGHVGRSTPDITTAGAPNVTTPGAGTTGGTSIQFFAPDLLILADMGINDIGSQVTPDTFAQALSQACEYAKAGNPACDIVIPMSHRGNVADGFARSVTDAVTAAASSTITSTQAAWSLNDVGAALSGFAGVPAGTTIVGLLPGGQPTQAEMSKNATAVGATGTISRSGPLYSRFVNAARSVAEDYGAALVDFWTIGRNSYAYWNGLQFFGDGTNDGLPGADPVHPSNLGHAFMASYFVPGPLGVPAALPGPLLV